MPPPRLKNLLLWSGLVVVVAAGVGLFVAFGPPKLLAKTSTPEFCNRGVKPLNFEPQMEFKDPFGIQDMLTPRQSLGLAPPAAASKTEEKK